MTRRSIVGAALAAAALVVVTACSGDTRLPDAVEVTVPVETTPSVPAPPTCTDDEAAQDPTRSYEPIDELPSPGDMPSGSTMARILERGRLIVGVSGDTRLFGARDSKSGDIEGFDVDMLKQVALAIFGGDEADINDHIEYKVITYAQRLPALEAGPENGGVDIVAHTMTINCNRWLRIAFSSEYFQAGQKVLVKSGSGYESVADLVSAKARVCAPLGSTNIDEINKPDYAGISVIGKPDITDCLVAMQQGQADATTGDDTVLAGFAAQDPNVEVVGGAFTGEPYGLGIGKDNVDFVRFVNSVLEQVRDDGRWEAIYDTWLTASLGPSNGPPAALYGREP